MTGRDYHPFAAPNDYVTHLCKVCGESRASARHDSEEVAMARRSRFSQEAYAAFGIKRLELYVNAGGAQPCEVEACDAPAYPCACGNSHCPDHPHVKP
jgi:hypothetical protein